MIANSEGYRSEVDIWALGGVILELLTGQEPWREMKFIPPYFKAVFHIGTTQATPDIPATASKELRTFLGRCFVRDPNLRASARALLQDPFLAGQTTAAAASSR